MSLVLSGFVWYLARQAPEDAPSKRLEGVTVQRDGAGFASVPRAGSARVKGTAVLKDSRDNMHPWENDDFQAEAFCLNPSGEYVMVQESGSGLHSSGQKRDFDVPCPPGTTAGKYRIFSDESDVWLEWDAKSLRSGG